MDFELWTILYLIFAFLTGGILKGAMGIGLPAYLIGLLTFVFEPRLALAISVVTILTTNARQAWIGEPIWNVAKRMKVYLVTGTIAIFVVALIGANAPVPILMIAVGISMVIFGLTGLYIKMPKMPESKDNLAQTMGGLTGGILGGLTGIWAPPLAIYLMTKQLQKDVLVQTMGVVFFMMCLPLILAMIASGELTLQLAFIGVLSLIPTFFGMAIGERLRAKMDLSTFVKVFLWLFIILGFNLIRRGVWV